MEKDIITTLEKLAQIILENALRYFTFAFAIVFYFYVIIVGVTSLNSQLTFVVIGVSVRSTNRSVYFSTKFGAFGI